MNKENPGNTTWRKRARRSSSKVPIYDDGGPVDLSSLTLTSSMGVPAVANGLGAGDPAGVGVTPMGKVKNFLDRVGKLKDNDNSSIQRQSALAASNAEASQAANTDLPVMDSGGVIPERRTKHVSKNAPNVNDGNHQLAILETGERVLTPQQNAMYEKDQHGLPCMGSNQFVANNDWQPVDAIEEQPRSQNEIPRMGAVGAKRDIDGKLIPVYDEGGDVSSEIIPSAPQNDPRGLTLPDALRDKTNSDMIEAEQNGDIMSLGMGALAHNQLDKHENRVSGMALPGELRPADNGLPKVPRASDAFSDESLAGVQPTDRATSGEPRNFNLIPTPGTKADVQDTKHILHTRTDDLIRSGAPLETIDESRARENEFKLDHPTLHGIPRVAQHLIPTQLRESIPSTATGMREQILGAENEENAAAKAGLERAQAEAATRKPKDWQQVTGLQLIDPTNPGLGPQVAFYDRNNPAAGLVYGNASAVKEGTPKAPQVKFSQGGEPLSVVVGSDEYVAGDPRMPKEAQQVMAQAQQNFQNATSRKQEPLSDEQASALNATYDKFLKAAGMPTGQFGKGMTKDERTQLAQAINSGLAAYRAAQAAARGNQEAQDKIADQRARYESIQGAINNMSDVAPMFDKKGVGVALAEALTPQLERLPVGGLIEGVPVGISIPAGALDNLVTRGAISASDAQQLINRYNLAAEAAIQFLMVQQGGKIGRGGPALMGQVQSLIPGKLTTSSADARDKLNLFQNQFDTWKKFHPMYAQGLTSFRDNGYTPSTGSQNSDSSKGGFAAWKAQQDKKAQKKGSQ